MSSGANAEGLVNRLADAVDTWSTGALLEAYGGSRPLMIAGRDVSVGVMRAGRIIKWGGLIGLSAGLISDSLNWYYGQAQQASTPLGDWWNGSAEFGSLPNKANVGFGDMDLKSSCIGMAGNRRALIGWYDNGDTAGYFFQYTPGAFNQGGWARYRWGNVEDTYNSYRDGCNASMTLNGLAASSPEVTSQIKDIVGQYLRAHPEIAYSKLEPLANKNQKDDAVTDPGLDTDEDQQTDGDETRTGYTTNPGNRPNPGDGGPSDPNEPTSKSPDTDDDGVPDWRDGDDDDDGTPDNDEPTSPSDCQKQAACNPETERDTDNDGSPDREDADDDNDGFPDVLEETEGSDPKDPDDKPTDKPCAAGQVRGPGGKCEDEPEPPPCPAGQVRGAGGKCEPEPPPQCPKGQVRGESGKCEPEKDPPKCPEGKKLDTSEPPKCVDDLDPKDPVDDTCGTFGIKRLLTHTGHYLRDVVFPCEDDYGWIDEIREAASTKFPFSLTSSLDNMVSYSGSSDQSSALPSKLGPFDLDWSWLAPLILVVGLLFKGFIGWIAVDIILSRLSGQVVIK